MDNTIFKKLKAKPGMTAALLYAPTEYPLYEGFSTVKEGKDDFVHLFVASKAEFEERFADATDAVTDDGLLWVSYPKSKGRQKYDINRDILWNLVLPLGWHPVSQVSLDEHWSAVRLKRNEPDVVYERPSNVKSAEPKVDSDVSEVGVYINGFSDDVKDRLHTIRNIVKEIAPDVTERICMRIPTFDLDGKWFVHYAGFKKHIGFYSQPDAIVAFGDKLKGYKTSKGAVQFPLNKPLPVELIREIISYRLRVQEG